MTSLFDVSGKVALVTGGSRGIGAMIASGLSGAGAHVIVCSRKGERSGSMPVSAEAAPARMIRADVATSEGRSALRADIAAREGRLDILVNNAGATWGAPIETYPESGWDKVLNLNLKAVFFLIQELLPLLRSASSRGRSPRIVNISSVNAISPSPVESYAYTASKAGCTMLTQQLAKRLVVDGILVNAIAPGPFMTDMSAQTFVDHPEMIEGNPMGRAGRPEEIAGTVIFLASAASGYMTGSTIACDGGMLALR